MRVSSLSGLRTLLSRQACDLCHGPYFDGADPRSWNPCGDADRLAEILGVDEEVAAQLFARLCERPIGHERFTVANPNAGRLRSRMQRCGAKIVPARVELLRELHRLLQHLLTLRLGALAERFFIVVNQQHVFHMFSSVSESNGECPNRHATRKLFRRLYMLLDASVAVQYETVYRYDCVRESRHMIRFM